MTTPEEARAEITRRLLAAGQSGLGDADMRLVARAQAVETTELATPIEQLRDRRCIICNAGSDITAFVNKMIVSGATYMSVYRALEPINEARIATDRPEIKYHTITRHAKNHLPFRSAAVREIVERRARAAQLDFESGAANILTIAGFAEAVMTRSMQDMANSEERVPLAEGIKAAVLLEKIQQEEKGNAGVETAFAELGYLIEAVKEVVPAEYFHKIVAKIEEKRGSKAIEAAVVEDFDPGEQEDDEVGYDPPDEADDENF